MSIAVGSGIVSDVMDSVENSPLISLSVGSNTHIAVVLLRKNASIDLCDGDDSLALYRSDLDWRNSRVTFARTLTTEGHRAVIGERTKRDAGFAPSTPLPS